MQRGYFGIGVFHPKHEQNIGTLLRSAYNFGASFVFTVGHRYRRQASDTPDVAKHIPLHHHLHIYDLVKSLPLGCPLIGIEINENSYKLPDFKHPERACYVLGAEDYGLTDEAISACHSMVAIPGLPHCLNVAVAGSIVLYDRKLKIRE